jgi:integrase
LRGYEQALRDRILPELGGAKLADVRRSDVQRLANAMLGDALEASTIRNAIMPLRAIYRHAIALDEVAVNPTAGLHLPAARGKRDRIASPEEAADLIAALPAGDRAIWATALYAGLRLGELLALDWADVDLAAGVIRVERSYDARAGVTVKPKSRAGRRTVPVAAILRDELVEHRMRQGRSLGLAFGRSAERPFNASTIWARARRAWKDSGLEPIGLHECRHTFASLMIAAGVNAKALAAFMGHSSVTITLDRYGHLMPGSEDEAAGLLDAYLERASTRARLAAIAEPVE